MLDKWYTLKQWLNYMADVERQRGVEPSVVINYMNMLEEEDKSFAKQLEEEGRFLFTGVPTFDKKAWEEILEERGLQGLA